MSVVNFVIVRGNEFHSYRFNSSFRTAWIGNREIVWYIDKLTFVTLDNHLKTKNPLNSGF